MGMAAGLLVMLANATAQTVGSTTMEKPMSATIIGAENPLLVDGANALEQGRASDGVRLTLEGLKYPANPHDVAAAHSNLCAGYALLQQWDEALAHCNTSITLDAANWRAYNNRAAVFSARGLYEEAIKDVQSGLKLAPGVAMLHKSLEIIYHNQRVHRRQSRAATNA
jgi:tetratricopeptide (TPR) repeat protein